MVGVALALSGCATGDPLDPGTGDDGGSSDTIVVGSAEYYSNEIIAEIYAQALENAGLTVERQFNIGQRDVYLPALEAGDVDLLPEYTGNLLQYYDPETTATSEEDVNAALADALPTGSRSSTCRPRPTRTPTTSPRSSPRRTAASRALEDLAGIPGLILGGNAELGAPIADGGRPYGPEGLKEAYGIDVTFQATGDTTYDALVAGTISLANIYSADPRIETDGLVTLADPKGLFLASNVVPLVNDEVKDQVADIINAISAKLTPEGLVALNVQSTVDQLSSADIATQWLTDNGLLG